MSLFSLIISDYKQDFETVTELRLLLLRWGF